MKQLMNIMRLQLDLVLRAIQAQDKLFISHIGAYYNKIRNKEEMDFCPSNPFKFYKKANNIWFLH